MINRIPDIQKPSAAAEKLNMRIKELCNEAHKNDGIPISHLIAILANAIGQFEVAYMVDNPKVEQVVIEAMVIQNARIGAEIALKYLHEAGVARILDPAAIHEDNGSKN